MKVQEELGRVGPYLDRLCLLPETGTVLLPPSLGRRLSRGAGALTRREAPSCLPTPSGGVSAPGALTSAGALALSQVAGSITAVGGRPDGESPKALRQSELLARQRGRRQRELAGWKRGRRCGSCGLRQHHAGAASPALIGASPGSSASNCCWGWGWRGVGVE